MFLCSNRGIVIFVPLHLYPCDVKPHMKFLQKSHHGKLLMYVWTWRERGRKDRKVGKEGGRKGGRGGREEGNNFSTAGSQIVHCVYRQKHEL